MHVVKKLLFLCALALGACDGDSSNDGGADATAESAADLCDINLFSGNGNACPHASTRVCFSDPSCEAGNGCTCKDTNGSPTWSCFTPPECLFPCSSSPLSDAACDSGDETSTGDDAGADAATEAGDASTD